MNDIDDIRARAETCWTKTQLRADVQTLLARVDELESDCAALKVGIEAISSLCDRKDAERERLKAQVDALDELVEALGQGYQAENGFCDRFCLAHPENQNPHNNYKCDCGGDAIRKALAKVEQGAEL